MHLNRRSVCRPSPSITTPCGVSWRKAAELIVLGTWPTASIAICADGHLGNELDDGIEGQHPLGYSFLGALARFVVNIRMSRIAIGTIAGVAGIWLPVHAEPLTVGAPPSLRPALSEILPIFEREYDAPVNIVYTPSKTLIRNIEKGAPIDVFLSAGKEEVDQLYRKGLTLNGHPRIYAQTSLVLVMSSDSPSSLISFRDAFQNRSLRIALGDPQTSSLGDATARALSKLYPAYKRRPNIVYAPHSEEIMEAIRAGKADVGIVYRVDTINSGYVRISDEDPFGTLVPIQFGQAIASTCRAALRSTAEQFSSFLMSLRIQKLLVKYGFDAVPLPVDQEPAQRKERPS
jgi:molybdate transport system substrate-binding protein